MCLKDCNRTNLLFTYRIDCFDLPENVPSLLYIILFTFIAFNKPLPCKGKETLALNNSYFLAERDRCHSRWYLGRIFSSSILQGISFTSQLGRDWCDMFWWFWRLIYWNWLFLDIFQINVILNVESTLVWWKLFNRISLCKFSFWFVFGLLLCALVCEALHLITHVFGSVLSVEYYLSLSNESICRIHHFI